MAEDIVSLNSGWIQVAREAAPATTKNLVRIRRSGDVALSSVFVRVAGIADCTRADIFISGKGARLGLRFHSDHVQQNSFVLCRDGGSGLRNLKSSSRVIQTGSVRNQSPHFEALLRFPAIDRTFEARKDTSGFWVIELRPAFENTLQGVRGEIGPRESGIYRYLLDGHVVYIGRGTLSERFLSKDRSEWQFDAIEYSVINNRESEILWESYWLSRFKEINHRWPVYNRIGGKTEAEEKDGCFGSSRRSAAGS